jgi:ligand-binding sensor domain-containing protein
LEKNTCTHIKLCYNKHMLNNSNRKTQMKTYYQLGRVSASRNSIWFEPDQQNLWTARDGGGPESQNPIGRFETREVAFMDEGFNPDSEKVQVVIDFEGRVWIDEDRFESLFCRA